MTNIELESRLTILVKKERALTQEILSLIREGEKRRLYLERGFQNSYDWLVRGFGYSHGAAHRRIQAARLLESVPVAKVKLAAGQLNLNTLSQVQSAIKQEEKRTGAEITQSVKEALVEKIEGKSARETEAVIRTEFPEANPKKDSLRTVDGKKSRLTLILEKDALEAIKRVKELLSHSHPGASYAEIFQHLALDFVKRKDPLKQKNKLAAVKSPASDMPHVNVPHPSKTPPAAIRRDVLQRAAGKCEYKDPLTGRVCGSRLRVEIEHRQPLALGGTHDPGNLLCYCKSHNLLAAERVFGAELMSAYRRFS